jgi:hypothetical protein
MILLVAWLKGYGSRLPIVSLRFILSIMEASIPIGLLLELKKAIYVDAFF